MPGVKVALVNAQEYGDRLPFGVQSYGLAVISKALCENGFDYKDVRLFPKLKEREKEKRNYETTAGDVARMLEGSEIPVVGISALSNYWPYIEMLAELKQRVPNAVYVGGGPHFAKEDWEFPDSIDLELESGRLDAAVDGHCNAFIEMCEGLSDGRIEWDGVNLAGELPRGLYAASDGKARGSGSSGLPDMKMPVVWTYFQGMHRVLLYINGSCPNGCDYCSAPGGSAQTGAETVEYIRDLLEIISGTEAESVILGITDNNPFMNNGRTLEFLGQLKASGIWIDKHVYVDDSLFAGDGWKEVYERCRELGITSLFSGRETPSADVAERLGRKLHGKPRSQELLDASYEGMRRFQELKNGKGISMRVSYMLTPFETRESAARTAQEMLAMETGPARDRTAIVVNNLVPYFGTRTRRMHRQMLLDPDNPFLLSYDTLNWNPACNPGACNMMFGFMRGSGNAPLELVEGKKRRVPRVGRMLAELVEPAFSSRPLYDSPVTTSRSHLVRQHARDIRPDTKGLCAAQK